MGRKLSGMQKEVLSLYRTLLREATKKDRRVTTSTTTTAATTTATTDTTPTTPTTTDFKVPFTRLLFDTNYSSSAIYATTHTRNEFRRQALHTSRKDFRGIEHKIRHGYKQVKLLHMPGVVTVKSW
mmetsp:Transcript_39035/g.42293  ORF Transcript_39035/g.42293 Transcript_39035/m.42293 type:complete len:126 (-) Transcript_39035:304-681(-)